ncbi:DUF4384 domain-containing protein [Desulfobacula toluolica]|uniref:DUF4384 domain-containing protein n=1 Tax=Desulfobacula toluolica (strain DSM 7467 / Tol2) TaxID=651182 RepID=K0N9P5_DESTT|nr:DUF4384 domain-containing protein [Desulfobacula toluolica]CCK80684.1 uncharacterized protein TOL2_C25250 [Desulfobacula toluolica Tol2]
MRCYVQNKIRLGLAVLMAAAITWANVSISEAISIRSNNSSNDDLSVGFEPIKSAFKVGEPIKFKITVNKKAYLYLFSINKENNKGVIILPNKLQEYNIYRPGKEYIVPEKEISFVGDRPGTEEIIMLASTKKLNLKKDSYKSVGSFFTTTADTMSKDIKALHIRKPAKKKEQVVRELTLVIKDNGWSSAGRQIPPPMIDDNPVCVFISSDRTHYTIGDTMKITYGADNKGFVYLYSIEPDKKTVFLKRTKVTGKNFYQEKGKVTHPQGRHQLVAVFSANGDLNKDQIPGNHTVNKTKGFALMDKTRPPMAVYHVNVRE